MIYAGHVENGAVLLDNGATLPEGARVEVSVVEASVAEARETPTTLYDSIKDFIGIVDDMPADLAKNHDHYLYGAPKK